MEARNKAIEEVNYYADLLIDKANRERYVMLYLLYEGISIDNVIYYSHTNELRLNWLDDNSRSYTEPIDFYNLVVTLDLRRLPIGLNVSYGEIKIANDEFRDLQRNVSHKGKLKKKLGLAI